MRVPEGWREVRLGDLGTWCGGGTPSKRNPDYWQGPIPWVSPKDMRGPELWDTEDHISDEAVADSATNVVPPGSVLLVTRSGILRHTLPIALAKVSVAINQDIKALQPGPLTTGYFAAQLLRWHEKKLLERCAKVGTTVESIDFSALLAFKVCLPPLAEQERISSILSSVDEAIESTQVVIDQLQVVKKAMMAELLTKGTPGRHSRFKKTEIGEVPEGWDVLRLGDCLREPIRNGYSPVCPKTPTGRWILHLGAVTADGFNPTALKPAPLDDARLNSATLESGDIVVSRSNTRERVGLAGMYRGEPANCFYPDLLMRVRTNRDLLPDFLELVLLSERGRAYLSSSARGTSESMVKINRTVLEAFPVQLPSLAEQREIVSAISSVQDRMNVEWKWQRGLQELKSALLAGLLTGEVRVPDGAPIPGRSAVAGEGRAEG